METLKIWLKGVMAASLLVVAAQSLMPEGTIRQVGRMLGGLVLFLAMVRPLLGGDCARLSTLVEQAQVDETQSELEEAFTTLTEPVITQSLQAYIQQEAEEQGIRCTACPVWREESGTLALCSVTLSGEGENGDAFAARLTEELGAAVHWEEDRE